MILRCLPALLLLLPLSLCVSHGGWETSEEHVIAKEGPCNVPRIDGATLTQQGFLERYAYTQPVIIYNVDNSEFARLTERQRMLDDWADTEVVLNSANTYSYTRQPSSLGAYVREKLRPQSLATLGNETMYLFGDIDQTVWKPLLDKYRLPEWELPDHEPALSFGLAGAGTGVPFHFHGPGFAEIVHGSKRWFLTPPDQQPAFDPDRSTLEWYLRDYPNLSEADRPMECLMGPGEVIYFPDRWWHATLNAETSVFISTFLSPVPGSDKRKQEKKAKFEL